MPGRRHDRPPGYLSLLLWVVKLAVKDVKAPGIWTAEPSSAMLFLRSPGLRWLLELGGIEDPDALIEDLLSRD